MYPTQTLSPVIKPATGMPETLEGRFDGSGSKVLARDRPDNLRSIHRAHVRVEGEDQ